MKYFPFAILLCVALTDCVLAQNRFVAKADNFSVEFPGRVKKKKLATRIQLYDCVVRGNAPTDEVSYAVTVVDLGENGKPLPLEIAIERLVASSRDQYPDLTLEWSTPVRCSGFPGIQCTCIFDKVKPAPNGLGGPFKLPSGQDVRVIQVGNRVYTLMVTHFVYDGIWNVQKGYTGTSDVAKQFFASFRLLNTGELPKAADEKVFGEWVDTDQEEVEEDILGLNSAPAFSFEKDGSMKMLGLLKGTFKMDSKFVPHKIDIILSHEGSTYQKGIYKLTDRGLEICLPKEGSDARPTEFKDTAQQVHWTLARHGDPIVSK